MLETNEKILVVTNASRHYLNNRKTFRIVVDHLRIVLGDVERVKGLVAFVMVQHHEVWVRASVKLLENMRVSNQGSRLRGARSSFG